MIWECQSVCDVVAGETQCVGTGPERLWPWAGITPLQLAELAARSMDATSPILTIGMGGWRVGDMEKGKEDWMI